MTSLIFTMKEMSALNDQSDRGEVQRMGKESVIIHLPQVVYYSIWISQGHVTF